MSGETVVALDVALYAPGSDSHGRKDGWAPPVRVNVHGWAPSQPDAQPVEGGNRRPVTSEREAFPLAMAGGPRARWTFPDGVFEQIGHAIDYGDGPWWHDGAAVVVYLRRVEG